MLRMIVGYLVAAAVVVAVGSTVLQLIFTGVVQEPCCWHSEQP